LGTQLLEVGDVVLQQVRVRVCRAARAARIDEQQRAGGVEPTQTVELGRVESGTTRVAEEQRPAAPRCGRELHASSRRRTAATARSATWVSAARGSRVVSRWSASPGSRNARQSTCVER